MTSEIRFGWHILYRAKLPLFLKLVDSSFFLARAPTSYFSKISAVDPTLYHPVDLKPTNLFHLSLRNELEKKFRIKVRDKNFPYVIPIQLLGEETRLSVFIQVFLPDIIALRITCYNSTSLVESKAFKQRQFHNHEVVKFIADFTASRVELKLLGSRAEGVKMLQAKPLMYLTSDEPGREFFKENKLLLCALLINDEHFRDSNPSIADNIIARNEEHNAKGESARLILLNKQSFLAVTTRNVNDDEKVQQEISKKERLYELGAALQKFYETYPSLRVTYMREMDYLFFATKPYVNNETLTFKLSYSNTLAWRVIMSSFHLVGGFTNACRFDVDSESQISNLFDKIPHPNYCDQMFWEKVRSTLGDKYMANDSGGYQINIETNKGSVAAGPDSRAITLNVSRETREAFEGVLAKLSELGSEIGAAPTREEYNTLISEVRSEMRKDQPNSGVIARSLGTLQNLAEGTASGLIASGLIYEGSKLLGLS